jgi:ribosome-associated protein
MELSRSEQKRRIKRLEELVEALAALPSALIGQLPIDKELRGLLLEAAALGRNSTRRRLIKHVTKLLREEDSVDSLYQFVAERKGAALLQKKQQHELEFRRDALIEEAIAAKETQDDFSETWSSDTAAEIAAKLPFANQHELTRLAFLFAVSRNPRHSREIFRILKAAQERGGRQ